MKRPSRIMTLFLTIAGGALVLILLDFIIHRCFGIPPRDFTRANMSCVKCRILKYAHQHGRLPDRLDALPDMPPGYVNETTDWWGNPIHFEVDAQGIVTLGSHGGRAWGYKPRESEPVVCKFPTKKPSGEWSDELVDFISEGQDREE